MDADAHDALAPYGLLASAIAGRAIDIAPAAPGEPSWTDGSTVFVATHAAPGERVRSIVVQAALLGAGSIDADVLGGLARRPALMLTER